MRLYEMMRAARLEIGYPELEITNEYCASLVDRFSSHPDLTFIQQDDGFLIGMKTTDHITMPGIPMAYVISWYVDPAKRKTGIGMDLYNAFEQWARLNNCEYILQGKPTPGCTKVGIEYLRKLD